MQHTFLTWPIAHLKAGMLYSVEYFILATAVESCLLGLLGAHWLCRWPVCGLSVLVSRLQSCHSLEVLILVDAAHAFLSFLC